MPYCLSELAVSDPGMLINNTPFKHGPILTSCHLSPPCLLNQEARCPISQIRSCRLPIIVHPSRWLLIRRLISKKIEDDQFVQHFPTTCSSLNIIFYVVRPSNISPVFFSKCCRAFEVTKQALTLLNFFFG